MNKTLIIACIYILLISAICSQAQTIEQRLDRIEDSLNINWNVIITNDSLPQPIYEGIVMQSFTSDQYIFNPSINIAGVANLYCIRNGAMYLAKSNNGLNGWTYYLTNGQPGSIVYVNGRYSKSYHKWYGAQAFSYYAVSMDGLNFTDIATSRTPTGEDRNVLYNGSEYFCYGRLQPVPRSITFSKSPDFRNWSAPVEIFKSSIPNIEYYHMSVIKTEQGYFGLLNVYYKGNAGQDVDQPPPYVDKEHTTAILLTYSQNGIDNWRVLKNGKEFVTKQTDVKQIFGWWSVVNGIAYIYTAESKRRHTVYENNNINGRFYYSSEYKITLNDLYKYLN